MAHSPSYSKVPLQDPGNAPSAPPAIDEDVQQGYKPPTPAYDPPPPYEAGYYGAPQGYQPTAQGPAVPYGQPPPAPYGQPPHAHYGQPPSAGVPVVYPQYPVGEPVVPQQPVPAPVAPQPAQATVVVTQILAPGVCSVCRKGTIRDGSTFWTYMCCLFWCIFGCLPGILAYFCCCRKPKCSHCGYTV